MQVTCGSIHRTGLGLEKEGVSHRDQCYCPCLTGGRSFLLGSRGTHVAAERCSFRPGQDGSAKPQQPQGQPAGGVALFLSRQAFPALPMAFMYCLLPF